MSKKSFFLTVLAWVLLVSVFLVVLDGLSWWAALIIIPASFRLGCWGGRLDARGKPKYSLPDGGTFETHWQYGISGGFEFLLKRLDPRPRDGFDYYLIHEEILDGQTKMGLGTAPSRFRVSVVTLADKTVYLFYSF